MHQILLNSRNDVFEYLCMVYTLYISAAGVGAAEGADGMDVEMKD